MKHHKFDDQGELRDIFAALAMQALMNQPAATHKWVAYQAYKYADYMLDERNETTYNKENQK
jgi:hypothetical protein